MDFANYSNTTTAQHFYSRWELRCNSNTAKEKKILRIGKTPKGPELEGPVNIGSILCENDLYTFHKENKLRSNLENIFNGSETTASKFINRDAINIFNENDLLNVVGLKLLNIFRSPLNHSFTGKIFENFADHPIRHNPENIIFRNLLKNGNHKRLSQLQQEFGLKENDREMWLELIYTLAEESTNEKVHRPESLARFICKELFSYIEIHKYTQEIVAVCDRGYVELSDPNGLTSLYFNLNKNTLLMISSPPIPSQPEEIMRIDIVDDLERLMFYNQEAFNQCHLKIYTASKNILGVTK
ncbi:DUF4238 domain-containing protein [Marinagarivorans cellulosilyticus]|uniref:DUF4238 domain-containing protein n=1 Tax=Marinagarivorans cellulosilyticus TaxID=2721545 RepID=A0AAN1WEM9_9GAMM|nr:DUF4238 domain-containing protein [Marinagarivorans cellulosilyticus]BCD96186.1 hypothetical protein MARGE09_P0385 [Marinagarivorans cellulosilyticus]